MENKKYYFVLLVFIYGIFFCSCHKIKPGELSQFINNPENGLSKTRTTNGITVKVKYLPADILAYKEFVNSDMKGSSQFDSLRTLYANGTTFIMEIIPETGKDIMLRDIHSEAEYKERVNTMNFSLKEFIELKTGDKVIAPSIATLENIYGLKNSRKVMVVFPINTLEKDMQFTFMDEIYSTGINHFMFLSKDLKAVPEIQL